MEKVKIKDKVFRCYIAEDRISTAIESLASKINSDFKEANPLFLVVLNGSFMFAADLLRKVNIDCDISFIKVSSYNGLASSGQVNELIGLTEEVNGRQVIIIEDIVDTGSTLEKLYYLLKFKGAVDIKIATLLFKPEAYKKTMAVDLVGIEIPNKFVVGYGLDYDGQGRNLKEIYVLDN